MEAVLVGFSHFPLKIQSSNLPTIQLPERERERVAAASAKLGCRLKIWSQAGLEGGGLEPAILGVDAKSYLLLDHFIHCTRYAVLWDNIFTRNQAEKRSYTISLIITGNLSSKKRWPFSFIERILMEAKQAIEMGWRDE